MRIDPLRVVLRAGDRIDQQAAHLFVKGIALVRPVQCDVETRSCRSINSKLIGFHLDF